MRINARAWIILAFAVIVCLLCWRKAPVTPHSTHPLRVRNTDEPIASLARRDRALLLRNAVFDTTKPPTLDLPADLRATNGRVFIVQSDRPLDQRFYDALAQAGAKYISYIPYDAALVEASSNQVAALGSTFYVTPFEPYFKLASDLLQASVKHEPVTNALRIVTLPGSHDQALTQIQGFGWPLIGEDKTPMGPEFIVQVPGPNAAITAAQWPLAQEIELYRRRQPLNDLTRVRLGIATNTITRTNYYGLDGSAIWMNQNDTGADSTHPDLAGRIHLDPLTLTGDNDGHGTHVAGILIGNGSESTNIHGVPSGSVPGANFRGMAPKADLFVQSIDLVVGPLLSDEYLETNASFTLMQDSASQGGIVTNGFISNNSWGTGDLSYDIDAASFDAAVRDAQPLRSGEQAMTYVFAAGNSGDGTGNGLDNVQNTITSPGTAKNVITVGAIDSPRDITNQVSVDCSTTNAIFLTETSDSNQVVYFSSAGNVNPTIEGDFGRFKPDVVAPGVFIVSTRSANYQDPTNDQFVTFVTRPGQLINPGETIPYIIQVPDNSQYMWIEATPNTLSPVPLPPLNVSAQPFSGGATVSGFSPLLVSNQLSPGLWEVDLSSSKTNRPVNFDLNVFIVRTNYLCDYYTVLSNMNYALQPYYRYESGTSMSAPAAAGTLALIQQYFIESNHITPTPALLKALLINGARSLNHIYDFNTRPSSANIQGWGLINLPNSLPQGSNGVSNMAYFDQSQSPPLRTGESNSYTINLPDSSSVNFPLRVTLVWTDPPGNPAAGLALVNDLDLVVTDSKGAVYVGNDFESGDIYTRSNSVGNAPTADFVNNVENVYIGVGNGPLAPPYTVTVRGHRVNVNAVTTQTNNIEQDYALVISSDNTNSKASMSVSVPSSLAAVQPFVTIASNGVALLNQRVGANSPYDYQFAFGATNGTPSQWHFFIFTNDTIRTYVTNTATNVAFVTFLPPNLSVPRVTQEADIDLYVSTNFNLTNLNSATIAKAVSDGTVSRNRGGTEAVVFSNSLPNSVYYIGVKSEDQQAATFGFLGVASLTPFSDQMPDGDVVAHGIPLPLAVPDGSFDHPGMTNVLAVVEGGDPIHIRHVIVTNGIAHRHPTDLVGTLSFSGKAVTLNNQTGDSTNYVVAYDDEPEGPSQDPNISTVFTDGPGSLKDYIGLPVGNAAVWRLDETDNALGQVGSITRLDILMEHQPPNTGTFAINLQGFGSYYGYVIVPTDATNLGIAVTYQNSGNAGPVSIYATNDPDVNTGDTLATMDITPPGGALNINSASNPPISGGVWYYLIQNNGAADVSLNVTISIQRRLTPNFIQTFTNKVATALTTDAHTKSQICIDAASLAQAVVSVNVGVRLNDPDLDNLALHLTSPVGTSVLLFENRGGPSATNLGLNSSNPNEPIYTIFTEDTNLTSSLIKFTPVFAQSNYVAPASIVSSFEAPTVEGTYETGSSVDKWTVLTNQIGVVADPNVARDGDNFLALTTARISRSFDTTVGTTYHFVYYARGPGIIDWWPANGNANDIIGGNDGVATNIIYDDGVFGKGFYFNGSNSLITFGTQAGNFRTNDFTIDYWVNRPPANITSEGFLEKRLSCDASSSFISLRWGGTGFVYGQHGLEVLGESYLNDFDFMPSIDDHTWHHIVWTRRGSLFTGYLDGISPLSREVSPIADINNNARLQMGPSVCLAGDKTVPYNGAADELDFWSRALCPAEALAIFRAGSAGKYSTNSILPNMFVSVDDHTTNLVINNSTNWVAYTNTFVASSSKTTIEFAGNSALSMLLDDITLTALPSTNFNNYFKPEESLSAFVGENPVGCWTLDVWDTRTDNVLPTHGTLQSWTLDLTFSSTNVDLIVLTNHVPYSNSITAQSTVYLAFDAPGDAHYATNTITNSATPGTLNLVFNQQALPTGTSAGDAFFALNLPSGASSATVLNDTSSQPPLEPGNRYFLAVQNPNAAAKQYTVQVDTDIPPTNQLTALGNGVLVRTNIIGNGGPQYFSFDVPENAVLASFQVLNAINGEVDLYARYGLPLPGPLNFDYESVAFDSSNQPIVVTTNSSFTTNSAPQPLQPGTWYLATYGRPPIGALSYQIIASYLTDDRVVTIIPLTNGVAFTNIAAPGYPTNLFYSFTNHVKAAGVRFVLTNLTAAGNVDLVVGWGSLPTPAQSYSGSFNLGAIPERVDVATNDLLPALTKTWYLAVPNDWTNKVRYAVEALSVDVPPITNFPSIAQQSIGRDFGFTLTWASAPGATYQVDYSTDLIDWIPAARLTATNNVSSYTDATPVTNESARYYRLRQEPSE